MHCTDCILIMCTLCCNIAARCCLLCSAVRYSSHVCGQHVELDICTVACFLHAWHAWPSYCMMHMHCWYDVRSFWCTVFFGVVRSFSLKEAGGLKSRVLLEAQWRLLSFIFILNKLMCYLTALWALWVCLRRELFGNRPSGFPCNQLLLWKYHNYGLCFDHTAKFGV